MKEYAIQYIDENNHPQVAYIRARNKDEALMKFRKGEC